MARTAALVDGLKRELRARNITYAAVARRLGMSEASVKRMFSRKEFTLSRLDAICELAGMEFSDLARSLSRRVSRPGGANRKPGSRSISRLMTDDRDPLGSGFSTARSTRPAKPAHLRL